VEPDLDFDKGRKWTLSQKLLPWVAAASGLVARGAPKLPDKESMTGDYKLQHGPTLV